MSESIFQRLPPWLRPLRRERRSRFGALRVTEFTILVVVGLLLTVVTVTDLMRHVRIDDRLTADAQTWRSYTGHYFVNITTENGEESGMGKRDVACANTSEGAPGARVQICLIMTGPIAKDGMRAARGGYYLPPYHADLYANRYGCFGTATTERLCGD